MIKGLIRSLFKFVFFVFFIILSVAQSTDADLNDRGVVFDNRFSAGTLDISEFNPADGAEVSSLFNTAGVVSEGYEVRALRLKNVGKTDILYSVKIGGDINTEICKALNLRVFKNWEQVYTGEFSGLNFQSRLSSENTNDFMFVIQFVGDKDKLDVLTCNFDMIFDSWPDELESAKGLHDEEIISNVFSVDVKN